MKTSTNLISRFRIARMIGLVACVAWPLILMLLIMTEKVVPGNFVAARVASASVGTANLRAVPQAARNSAVIKMYFFMLIDFKQSKQY